ncbi:hypothetical protein K523DRAFT_326254 [Schizophyllum commune Tattone D]|nr:hypothetical protein K523DRAFT_326254 [Schizophyllum commune Tattone D]
MAMTLWAVNLQPGVPLRLPEGGRFSLRNASLTGDHDSGYTELVLSISNADDGPPDHGVVCVLAPSFAVQQTLSLDLSPPQTYILEARGPNTISIIGLGSSNPRSLSTADHGQRSQDSDIFPPVQSNHDGDDAAEVSPAPPEEEVPGEPTSHALRCPDLLNDGAADEEATIVLQNLEVTILYAVQDWSGRWLLDRSDQPTTIRVGENHWMPAEIEDDLLGRHEGERFHVDILLEKCPAFVADHGLVNERPGTKVRVYIEIAFVDPVIPRR